MTASVRSAFTLVPKIDEARLQEAFAESRVVQIAPFLAGDAAADLLAHLGGRDDWTRLIKAAAAEPFEHKLADPAISAAQLKGLEVLAAPVADSGFRYIYDRIAAIGPDGDARETGTLLSQAAAFLSGADMRAVLHAITGIQTGFADAQATRYGPGQFLTLHHDSEVRSQRRLAYVLSLSEGWRPEWGGLLLFHDEAGEVIRGFVPRMNALTIFSVPRDHSVSQVASFAPRPRYSITGWFHGAQP